MSDVENELGRCLSVVKPNPITILLVASPGLLFTLIALVPLIQSLVQGDSIHPDAIPFLAVIIFIGLLFALIGLIHMKDEAKMYEHGFSFQQSTYLMKDCKNVSIQHRRNRYTRFLDVTIICFTYQENQVKLKTRYLSDFSNQFCSAYDKGY